MHEEHDLLGRNAICVAKKEKYEWYLWASMNRGPTPLPPLPPLLTATLQPHFFVSQGNGGTAHVQFVDDADEHGVTPQRAVPIIHIIKLPMGS